MSPPDGPPPDLGRVIAVFARHGVDYLLCGGAAAAAHGAERPTDDADCVVRRERANLDRLAAAMRELNARLRAAGMTDDEARLLPVQIDGATLADLAITTWMTDDARSTCSLVWRHLMAASFPMRNWRSERACSTAKASSFERPAWTTSSEQRSGRTGPKIGKRYPSCVPFVTPAMPATKTAPGTDACRTGPNC